MACLILYRIIGDTTESGLHAISLKDGCMTQETIDFLHTCELKYFCRNQDENYAKDQLLNNIIDEELWGEKLSVNFVLDSNKSVEMDPNLPVKRVIYREFHIKE